MLFARDSKYMLEHLVLINQLDPRCGEAGFEPGTHGIEDGPHVRVATLGFVALGNVIVTMVTFK